MKKEIGIIGLGRMGRGLATQWAKKGWKVVGFNRTAEVTKKFARKNFKPTFSLEEFVLNFKAPRVVWIMLSKSAVDEVLFGKGGLATLLQKGDIVIDGGNSFYELDTVRAKKLAKRGIKYMDVGVSGGPRGALTGACLMVGGKKADFRKLEPLFKDVALPNGVMHFEGIGAGHFVKMVHNGIEYGMMQAIAEGFAIMKKSKFNLNLTDVANIYQHGSVIESSLVGWLGQAFKEFGEDLKVVSGTVGHTGEGEWTAKTAKKLKVPAKIIADSFLFRVQSEKNPSFTGKLLSAMRNQFGRHNIKGEKRDA